MLGELQTVLTILLSLSWVEADKDTKIGDGVIQDTSGDVIFKVQFKAISCKPEKNEILDGKISESLTTGIQV